MVNERTHQSGAESATFDRLKAADLMERGVQSAHVQTKADVIASMMIEGFGGVPIIDDRQRLAGIVTEFDLLAALDQGKRLGDLFAGDIMTKTVVSVEEHTDVRTLLYVLQTNHVIRVPVVNRDGRLTGIVARRDVLQGYLASRG
ncbi:MAG: CBS domain-containing protein [Nitrospiraceae bacterium]